jgi:phosphate starvation-inducible membrane PsiE
MAKRSVKETLDRLGEGLVSGFQLVALFVIGATIVWSAASDYLRMVQAGRAGLDDILLLFIYLELGTIVGIYFKTDRLPVLFLLYVAITALTRFLAVDIKDLSIESMLAVTGSILVLTLAALVVQIAASRFATPIGDKQSHFRNGVRPRAEPSPLLKPVMEPIVMSTHTFTMLVALVTIPWIAATTQALLLWAVVRSHEASEAASGNIGQMRVNVGRAGIACRRLRICPSTTSRMAAGSETIGSEVGQTTPFTSLKFANVVRAGVHRCLLRADGRQWRGHYKMTAAEAAVEES